MGQPPHWKPYFGAFVGVNNLTTTDMATNVGGLGLVGIYRDLINPLVGVGVAAEGYGGYIGEEVDGGVRLDLALPVVFLQGGVDYSFGDGTLAFILSFAVPIRRGGILGHGSLARIDWLPSRGQTLNVGLQVPMLQPWVGKTRPKAQDITIPRASHAQFERSDSVAHADTTEPAAAALAQMRREALWTIDLINVFYTGLGKSYDDGLATQRDTIAAYIRCGRPHRSAAPRRAGIPRTRSRSGMPRCGSPLAWRPARPPRPPPAPAWRSRARHGARCSTRCSFPTTHDSASTRIPTRSWDSAQRGASPSPHGSR